MATLKKPEKIKADDPEKESAPEVKNQDLAKNPEKVAEQANPDEVPPLPDDDKDFDREPEKRLE